MHVQTCTALLLSVVGNVLLYVFDCAAKNFNYLPVLYRHSFSYLLKNNTIAIVQEIFHIQYSCNVFHHRPLFSERPPTLPSSPAPNLQSLEFPQT